MKDSQTLESLISLAGRMPHGRDRSIVEQAANMLGRIAKRNVIAVIAWTEQDILNKLNEEGYEPSVENLNIVCNTNLGLYRNIEETSIAGGWEAIESTISSCSDTLKKKE